jgi:O-antigen ligase
VTGGLPFGPTSTKTRGSPFDATSAAALAARHRPVPRPLPALVRLSFLLFILTIPFEGTEFAGPLSPARIAGLLFFGCCLCYPRTCFRRPSPAMLWFCCYLILFCVMALLIPSQLRRQVLSGLATFVQLLLFFWIGSALLQDTRLVRRALLAYGAACSVLALGSLASVPGISSSVRAGGGVRGLRATALDYNANALAMVLGAGIVMLVGLLLDNTRRSRGQRWLLLGMVAPMSLLLVNTGSRGGLLALVAGMSLFLVPLAPSRRRIAALGLGVFALIALAIMVARNPVSAQRVMQTVEEGRVAGRDVIYRKALGMIEEKPILGWGPVYHYYELGTRLGLPTRDPHNGFLWLLLECGIVGTAAFGRGYWLCARAAWRSRWGPEGILPLALMVLVTVMNFSGTILARKPMWLVMAIALASPVVSTQWQRALSLRNRPNPNSNPNPRPS